jgi:predicted nucleic acid-binding protein
MSFWGPVYSREERLTKRKPPFVDTLLATTAELHGLTMVTRNEKDFPKSLTVINPWKV